MVKSNAFEPLPPEGSLGEENYIEQLNHEHGVPDFLDDNERAIFAEVVMGEEVIVFLNTDAGRMIRALVKQDVRENIQSLKSTSAWRTRRIRDLQTTIHQGETILFYLADVIQRGEHAYNQLQSTRKGL